MDITKLKDQLEPEEYSALDKYVSDLVAQTESARKELTEGRQKKRLELESLQAQQEKILKALGLSLPEEIDDLPDMISRKADLERMAQQEKRLTTKLEATQAERDQAQGKIREAHKKRVLAEALGKYNVDQDVVAAFIEPRLNWDGDDLIFVSEAGIPSSVEDGIKSTIRSRPSLLRAAPEQGPDFRETYGAKPDMGGSRFERVAAIGRAFSKLLH